MSKKPLVGLTVVVHDRDRPQRGRDVHPAIITRVVSEGDGVVDLRTLVEDGVDYPMLSVPYMHGKGYVEGRSWRFPEDSNKVKTDAGTANTPEPQETPSITPGSHEPRNVGGAPAPKSGEAPNDALGERSDVTGDGSEKAKADADKEAAAKEAEKSAAKK